MVAESAALAIIATTIVVLALLTLATVYYVPRMLPGNDDHGEDHEGNEQPAGGHPA